MVNKTAERKDEVSVFCPLVKVDVAKREVWGVVTAESPDRDDEICDYASTVPYYKTMVQEMSKATDGENIFPLRAMHGLIAAGKGIGIEFRDETKEIYMGFKVVDDAEWKKVEENVYTGFSQGGRYIKKWKDGDYTKYTAKPIEVSLVDVPCLSRATYDLVRADGKIEIRKFSSLNLNKDTCACPCASCKDGNCSGCSADTKCQMSAKADKAVKYLVDSNGEKHLPYTGEDGKPNHRLMGAAWAALFNSGGHRGHKYEGPNKEQAKKKLKQIYAREGLDNPSEKSERIDGLIKNIVEDRIKSTAYGRFNKGMYTISRFAQITEDLKYLWMSLEYEREAEGDDSPVTDDLKGTFEDLLDHLLAYTEEQIEEERARLKE